MPSIIDRTRRARVYADAFCRSKKWNFSDAEYEQLEQVYNWVQGRHNWLTMVGMVGMPEQVRTQLLERWRRERGLSDEYQPLLKLLIDRKQILLLPVVIQKIMELWAAHARVLVIMVESVDILTPIELNNIQQACEIHTGYRVLMRTMHNSTLIAGFRVRAATLWYDASVSGRLTRMAQMVQYGN